MRIAVATSASTSVKPESADLLRGIVAGGKRTGQCPKMSRIITGRRDAIRPAGLTTTSRHEVPSAFWTRSVPALVAAPRGLNVMGGATGIRSWLGNVIHPPAPVPGLVQTFAVGQGVTESQQSGLERLAASTAPRR